MLNVSNAMKIHQNCAMMIEINSKNLKYNLIHVLHLAVLLPKRTYNRKIIHEKASIFDVCRFVYRTPVVVVIARLLNTGAFPNMPESS